MEEARHFQLFTEHMQPNIYNNNKYKDQANNIEHRHWRVNKAHWKQRTQYIELNEPIK